MNIVQREIAVATNKHLKNMRQMQPRQFDAKAFNKYCTDYIVDLSHVLRQSNPAMNVAEFCAISIEGV